MRILFNEEPNQDVLNILAFIEGVASKSESGPLPVDVQKIRSIVLGMRQDFPHTDGINKASVFKKLANFVAYFVSEKPVLEEFQFNFLPERLTKIHNYSNTIIALQIAFVAIHGAEICRSDGKVTIANPIALSEHSFVDLVDAVSNITPSTHFKLLTVLFEQLAYKSNPDCQYDIRNFEY